MSTGWNARQGYMTLIRIINLLGNEYWLERAFKAEECFIDYKPTGK